MDQSELLRFLVPDLVLPFEKARAKKTRFAHYTSAETALEIINGRKIWLRNVGYMNDVDEVHSGIETMLNNIGKSKPLGKKLWSGLDKFQSGLGDKTIKLFDDWSFDLTTNSYISCLSEHFKSEDKIGRLSMWRSYGNPNGVALIVKGTRMFQEESPHGAFTVPMIYKTPQSLKRMLNKFVDGLEKVMPFFKNYEADQLSQYIFHFLKMYTLAIKNVGFSEEKEWRIVYRPAEDIIDPRIITPLTVSLSGVVQNVYQLPLISDPDRNLEGLEIQDLLDRVIIGPTEFPTQMRRAFISLLENADVKNASEKVVVSNIPLRT
jgi:hypothetical protein